MSSSQSESFSGEVFPRLVLMRHGQTESNLNRVIDTRPPGAQLTELGMTQALEAGIELHKYCGERISTVFYSVATRARQTAELAAGSYEGVNGLAPGSVALAELAGVHEIDLGELEGRDDPRAYQSYLDHLAGWLRRDPSIRVPDGENYVELLARYQPALEALIDQNRGEDKDIVVVSHGGAIRVASALASGLDADQAREAYIPNCGFVILSPGGRPFGQWGVDFWAEHELTFD